MATDPRIPLMATTVNNTEPLAGLVQFKQQQEQQGFDRNRLAQLDAIQADNTAYTRERQATQDQLAMEDRQYNRQQDQQQNARAWKSLNMQEKLQAQKLAMGEFEMQDAREQQRFKSTVIGAAQLNNYLKTGDTEGARAFLQQRKSNLMKRAGAGENIDTQETDYALQMLDKDPQALREATDSLIETGQLVGVLEIPKTDERAQKNLDGQTERYAKTLESTGLTELVGAAERAFNATSGEGDIPGYGAVAGALPDIAVSKAGQAVRQEVSNLQNAILKARSGGAVTPQEADRFMSELGAGLGRGDENLRRGIKNIAQSLNDKVRNAQAGFPKEAVAQYEDRGGSVTRDRLAPALSGVIDFNSLPE